VCVLWPVSCGAYDTEDVCRGGRWQVKFWMLPACFAVTDVLSTQSPMAALPHVTGVLAGEPTCAPLS
jgi:hypothetical protein